MIDFKIATFNINKNEGEFPKRVERLSFEIPKLGIDILCLQEDFYIKEFSSAKLINEKLNYNILTTKTREKKRDLKLSSSNLTTLSKYKIKLLDEVYFNELKNEQRAVQLIKLKIGNKTLLIANTHLCHLSKQRRENHLSKIIKLFFKYKADIYLLVGDMNFEPNSLEYKLAKKFGFKTINTEATYCDGLELDYIFYKSDLKLEVESEVILKEYSDHYCLVNRVKV